MTKKILIVSIFLLSQNTFAQSNIEYLPYGDMNNWIKRKVVESTIIGGKEKFLYEITKGSDIEKHNIGYRNQGGSPWATSNVYACVTKVHKGVNNISPEKRDDGYCAKLETTLERVKVLGLFNLQVIATGTIFLGEMREPITSTNDANQYLDRGIPFTKRPKELIFDYSLKNIAQRMYASGVGKPKVIEGTNGAEVILILQKRWEDTDGNIYSKRIGMAWKRFFNEDGKWNNKFRIPIYYGDYSKNSDYADHMSLEDYKKPKEHTMYTTNSKGDVKPIIEVGWGDEKEEPTHLILSFSSGWGGAYMGSPGTVFCIDNIGFCY